MIIIRQLPKIYWGIETESEDRRSLTISWMMEDQIPYRESRWGWRIRVSHRHWLHFGWYRYRRDALHSGLMFRPTEIGKWGTSDQAKEAAEGEDEVRPAGPGEPAAGDRVESVEDSGVLLQADGQDDRHGLAAGRDGAPDRSGVDGDSRASRSAG